MALDLEPSVSHKKKISVVHQPRTHIFQKKKKIGYDRSNQNINEINIVNVNSTNNYINLTIDNTNTDKR